ncbi:unnamed protein product [Bathycoccus prasinos]|jgi:hypothetical protein
MKHGERDDDARRHSSSTSTTTSSSSSSIPFAHLSFFKSLSKNNNATQIGNDNDGGEKKNQQQQQRQQQQQQTQENCYQCRVVGTSACAIAASVVAYDRFLGATKRPLAHSLLYGAFGLGFAGLGVLRWNDLTFEDAEEMWRKLF